MASMLASWTVAEVESSRRKEKKEARDTMKKETSPFAAHSGERNECSMLLRKTSRKRRGKSAEMKAHQNEMFVCE